MGKVHVLLIRGAGLLRDVGCWLLDGLAAASARAKGRNTIALVRVDGIGDFVLWLGSARHLRDHFPGHRAVLICTQSAAELAGNCGIFEEVVAVDTPAFVSNPLYRWRLVQRVRRLGATMAVQPTYSREYLTGDALIRATGAARRIGSVGDLSNMRRWQQWIADRWYSQLIPADPTPLMELERNCEFLRGVGIENAAPAVATLPKVTELPASLKVPCDYFIVFPGAASTKRIWPPEKFGICARAISQRYGWRMVICGTAPEVELAHVVSDRAALPDAANFAGATSLTELVELIRGARFLLGNDTSALHIAAAVGTPSVGVLGGGHFGRFLPYSTRVAGIKPYAVYNVMECFGCNWRCIKSHAKGAAVPCVAAVEVDAVLKAADSVIGAARRGAGRQRKPQAES